MGAGGQHFERASGEIKMTADSTTHLVKEPPHWMVMWPVDASSGIPTNPVPNGTYIMFAGTPYAHLMLYQDPATMTQKDDVTQRRSIARLQWDAQPELVHTVSLRHAFLSLTFSSTPL